MKPGVTIQRDALGIPHITAKSREDLFWGEGYTADMENWFDGRYKRLELNVGSVTHPL